MELFIKSYITTKSNIVHKLVLLLQLCTQTRMSECYKFETGITLKSPNSVITTDLQIRYNSAIAKANCWWQLINFFRVTMLMWVFYFLLLTISVVRQLMACSTVCFCLIADDDGEELEPCRRGVVGQPTHLLFLAFFIIYFKQFILKKIIFRYVFVISFID